MPRSRPTVIAFAFFLVIFIITHAAKFPGSVAYLMEVTNNQPILDLKASFSSAETYQRLEAFGELGRRLYLQTMLTVDTIFPISAFAFLFLLSKYTSERLRMTPAAGRSLRSLSVAYLALDFLENTTVAVLLVNFPDRLDFLASNVGFLTLGKRFSMYGALLIPILLLSVDKISAQCKRGQAESMRQRQVIAS